MMHRFDANEFTATDLPLLAALTLLLAYGFYAFERKLVEAVPLEEVTVTEQKRPEWPRSYLNCKYRFPEISQHGKFMQCIRTDI